MFQTTKSLLSTRLVFHKCDQTIRGHVLYSFVALLLRKQLQDRVATKGNDHFDWADVMRDLDALTATVGKRLLLRSEANRTRSKTYQVAGVGLPPTAWLTSSAHI